MDQTLAAVKKAQEMGPKTVLVTSVKRPETPADQIEMLAVDGERAFLLSTPLLPFKRNGSGDVTAALFTGHYVETHDVKEALR
ncbi:bifunctional hydroxymethylpyrimidine kinase/phosphomethylpyrimidine kinase, partial [Klebsiella pneumoniae]|nr:bifunctional hydroxymethylpyrimidine kinase/phosphomethylpyrimidine kinase [Klebsiella pneumoniae]